jgi:S1-C subfamily serine protease
LIVALLALALGGGAGFVIGSRSQNVPSGTVSMNDFSVVYDTIKDAVVTVRTDTVRLDNGDLRGVGTAFHIGDGYYVTSQHIVAGANKVFLDTSDRPLARIEVPREDDQTFEASLIGGDTASDIALLKARAVPTRLEWATDPPRVGQVVLAIGNPRGDAPRSLSRGVVSGLDRVVNAGDRVLVGLLQTDAALNPGNSGGPLLDASGRVLGVNAAILSSFAEFAGVGYTVPTVRVKTVVETFRDGRKLERPSLGATGIAGGPARLTTILPGGNAQRAGLQTGDLVLRAGTLELTGFRELVAVIDSQLPGSSLRLLVQRGKTLKNIDVTLNGP